ncbi:MAG TPA: hypothetical protein VGW40_10040 [Allosphingosinicella sp.]|nr:hypothetical protein [Allosphingosinicella sp.]
MGKLSSALGGDIDSVINGIASATSSVQNTLDGINQVTSVFAALTPPHSPTRRFVAFKDSPTTINSALKTAMTAVLGGTNAAFKAQFPSDTPVGSDNGLIPDLNANGPLDTVVEQMVTMFTNWGIVVDSTQIASMAGTIQEEFNARGGVAGTSYGQYQLNTSETIDWTVGYGPITINPSQTSLIYGFTAALNYQM